MLWEFLAEASCHLGVTLNSSLMGSRQMAEASTATREHCSVQDWAEERSMEIRAANFRKLLLHIWERLFDFKTFLTKLGWKISGCLVIYGLPSQSAITILHIVFRASGSCFGTARSRWHPQAGLWMWCQLEKQGTSQTGRLWTHFGTSAKTAKACLDAVTQICEWELLLSRVTVAKPPRGWSALAEVSVAKVLHPWPAFSTATRNPARTAACCPVSGMKAGLSPPFTCVRLNTDKLLPLIPVNSY